MSDCMEILLKDTFYPLHTKLHKTYEEMQHYDVNDFCNFSRVGSSIYGVHKTSINFSILFDFLKGRNFDSISAFQIKFEDLFYETTKIPCLLKPQYTGKLNLCCMPIFLVFCIRFKVSALHYFIFLNFESVVWIHGPLIYLNIKYIKVTSESFGNLESFDSFSLDSLVTWCNFIFNCKRSHRKWQISFLNLPKRKIHFN